MLKGNLSQESVQSKLIAKSVLKLLRSIAYMLSAVHSYTPASFGVAMFRWYLSTATASSEVLYERRKKLKGKSFKRNFLHVKKEFIKTVFPRFSFQNRILDFNTFVFTVG